VPYALEHFRERARIRAAPATEIRAHPPAAKRAPAPSLGHLEVREFTLHLQQRFAHIRPR
jgi:hypothetical protein